MKKSKQQLIRNVLVPVPNAENTTPKQYPKTPPGCVANLTSSKPHTTLKILERIENLQLEDLDFDSDDDIVVGPPSFNPTDRLYCNLVSLNNKLPASDTTSTKTRRLKPVWDAAKKDPTPDSQEFLTHPPLTTFTFRQIMVPEFPKLPTVQDDHNLYRKLRRWKNDKP